MWGAASAGTLEVAAEGAPAVVLLDGASLGLTPVQREVGPGEHSLSFRARLLGADLFSESFTAPAEGAVRLTVKLSARTVRATEGEVPQPAAASEAPATAPPAATTDASGPVVDLFVQADGANINL